MVPGLKRSAVWFLVLAVCQFVCHAEVKFLLAAHRRALEDFARFRPVRKAKDLPPAVVTRCADHKGRLAEPGKNWEATCVIISDERLPQSRLIWAVTDGDYVVVHYERGGIGHSFHVMVVKFRKESPKPTYVWRGFSEGQLKDFRGFLDALKANHLDDRWSEFH